MGSGRWCSGTSWKGPRSLYPFSAKSLALMSRTLPSSTSEASAAVWPSPRREGLEGPVKGVAGMCNTGCQCRSCSSGEERWVPLSNAVRSMTHLMTILANLGTVGEYRLAKGLALPQTGATVQGNGRQACAAREGASGDACMAAELGPPKPAHVGRWNLWSVETSWHSCYNN